MLTYAEQHIVEQALLSARKLIDSAYQNSRTIEVLKDLNEAIELIQSK